MWKLLNLLPGKRRRMEQELQRELRYHTDRRVDDLMREGVPESEARRRVAIEFGGVPQVQEGVPSSRLRPVRLWWRRSRRAR